MRSIVSGAALLGLLPLLGCSREQPPPVSQPLPPQAASPLNTMTSPEYEASLPKIGGVEGYVGSESCRTCHEDEFASWHRSYHRTMTQIPAADTVQANFHNVTLTNDGSRFALSQAGDEFWVRMERLAAPESGEPRPEPISVRVSLVTGSHHMQVFWAPGGNGNMQIGFPVTWLIPEKRWVPRNSTFIRPPDAVHRAEIWNVVCSRCHATGIQPRVDSAARLVDTHAGELGISCEACHGPGSRHVELQLQQKDQPAAITAAATVTKEEIVHPKKLDPVRAAQVCGFCHSMKWIDRAEAWRQHGFRFRPGDDLEQTTPIIQPARVDEIAGLREFLGRNPDLLNDYFWPDGMVRVSGREYNGLLESPCYKGGKFSCLSCHSMHESEPDDQLARHRTGNDACLQCHESLREDSQQVAHTRHSAGSSGSQCYNCHMPHTTYGVLKAIRSHQISSPNIADQLSSGRPNACNLCHLDKPLKWTADHLIKWYDQPQSPLPDYAGEIAESVRVALSGDAGQRALIAWHFSWAPALQTAGTNWVAPVLGELLDDPYAAVRCVAERSLRAISNLAPNDYDYPLNPSARSPAREKVWRSWAAAQQTANSGGNPVLLSWPKDLPAQAEAYELWLKRRDERPMRLRE
jgi:predicted CXXCH cytochrome family protein